MVFGIRAVLVQREPKKMEQRKPALFCAGVPTLADAQESSGVPLLLPLLQLQGSACVLGPRITAVGAQETEFALHARAESTVYSPPNVYAGCWGCSTVSVYQM